MGALRIERDGDVLRVTLSRPETRNAFDACRSAEDATEPVTGAVLRHLDTLKGLPLAECRAAPLGALAADAGVLTSRLLSLHLARPLQSVKLIEQLGRASLRTSAL